MISFINMFIFSFIASLSIQTIIGKHDLNFNIINSGIIGSIVIVIKLLTMNIRENLTNTPKKKLTKEEIEKMKKKIIKEETAKAIKIAKKESKPKMADVVEAKGNVLKAKGKLMKAKAKVIDAKDKNSAAKTPKEKASAKGKVLIAKAKEVQAKGKVIEAKGKMANTKAQTISKIAGGNGDQIVEIVVRLSNGKLVGEETLNHKARKNLSKLGAGKNSDYVLMDPKYWLDETPTRGICDTGTCMIQPVDISGSGKYLRVDK